MERQACSYKWSNPVLRRRPFLKTDGERPAIDPLAPLLSQTCRYQLSRPVQIIRGPDRRGKGPQQFCACCEILTPVPARCFLPGFFGYCGWSIDSYGPIHRWMRCCPPHAGRQPTQQCLILLLLPLLLLLGLAALSSGFRISTFNNPRHPRRLRMVEGHGVARVAAAHRRLLLGHAFKATSPNGRFTDGARLIDRRKLSRIENIGKNLFYFFSRTPQSVSSPVDPVVVHIHFGMSGAFTTRYV